MFLSYLTVMKSHVSLAHVFQRLVTDAFFSGVTSKAISEMSQISGYFII